MTKIYFKIVLALAIFAPVFAGTYQAEIEQLIKDSNYTEKTVGVFIEEIEKCSVLVSINRDKQFNPASVMKLITATAAFDLLGSQYCFKTKTYLDGPLGMDSGIVKGNIYMRGGGDPGFLAERLWLFVQHLTHRGIKKIEGDLVLDDSFFDMRIDGPGFGEDGSSRAYEAPVSALSANFNTVAVHVAPGSEVGAPVHVIPFPRMKGVKIISTAKTSKPGSSSGLQVKTENMDGKTAILVFGDMSLDERPRYKFRKVYNTWECFGWILQGLFEESGIEFKGNVTHEPVPDSLKSKEPFYTFTSRPLPEVVFNMFKYSSNFAAEMLFKTVAAEKDTSPGSWENGAKIVGKWWKEKKFSGPDLKLYPVVRNGSGMGGENRVSPDNIIALLKHAWQQKTYTPEFVSALSIAGVDGTLESRFQNSHLKGIVRAKTGTLNTRGVSNLAGYVLYPQKTYAFVILINNKKKSQYSHWTLQQKILETVIPPLPEKKMAKEP